jgi:aminopeptidase N
VKDALEIHQIFDHISYLKGSSVIRMLSGHLGVETFLKGVSEYLKAHEYSTFTPRMAEFALIFPQKMLQQMIYGLL